VFIREQQAGAYSPILYFFSVLLAPFPTHLVANMLEAIIVYFLAELNTGAQQFFIYYFVTLFAYEVGIGMGLAISAALDNFMVATAMTPLAIIPMLFAGGLLSSTSRLWPYWVWLKHLSVLRYGYVIAIRNELDTVDSIACDANKFSVDYCSRQPQNGTAALGYLGLTGAEDQSWVMWTQFAVFDAMVYLIAMAMLYKAAQKRF